MKKVLQVALQIVQLVQNLAARTSVDIGNCFYYLVEVKKKIIQGKSSLTEAIDTTRKITESGKKNNKVKKAAVKQKKRSIAISAMTLATKNTEPSPAVASETSQGTTTEADFNVPFSKCTQPTKHQHRFEAPPSPISTFSVHQPCGTSQSMNLEPFNILNTPQHF